MTPAEKLRYLRETILGWKQGRMAQALTELVGGEPIAPNRISEWENGKEVDRYILASIALLHPNDPRGCLVWLRSADATMPGFGSTMPQDAPTDPSPSSGEGELTTLRDSRRVEGEIDAAAPRVEKPARDARKRKNG